MASLSFDATSVEITSRDPVPADVYEALITDSEIRATRTGNGKGINLTFEIVSGPHKGRKVFAWINFQHPKAEAQRIGQEELARICKAVGVGKLDDTTQHPQPHQQQPYPIFHRHQYLSTNQELRYH